MTPDEQAQLDQIEKERREREWDLLALLLAVCATSRSHAVHAVRSGNDPATAARTVILGDNGGFFLGVAPLVAQAQVDAYEAGLRRVGEMVSGHAIEPTDLKEITARYKAQADDYAKDLADRIGNGIREVERQALEPHEELQAIRFVFRNGQLTRQVSGRLESDVEAAICGAYSDGMMGGYHAPAIRLLLKGLRHESILDENTTPICRQRHNVQLPVDHPYWQTNKTPLHWRCRSVIMPILKDFDPTRPEDMPTIPPMAGFGLGAIPVAA